MLTLFYVLIVEQILHGLYNLWDALRWMSLAQRRAVSHSGFYAPRVALICPLKGLEPGLEQNLTALTAFDYPEYEIFLPMSTWEDPALKVAERVAAASKRRVRLLMAGRPDGCSDKVNNLRAAVREAREGFDAYVFVDSDGRASRPWLKRLVAPLADARIGAVTTFRWYFPAKGGFWSALASAWNAPAVTYLGEHGHNFCWGGGTAIRRERFEQASVEEYWRGSASDDLSLTQALRYTGLSIVFAPECLVPSVADCNADGLFEFTNRQMTILRVYEPKLWMRMALSHLVYCSAVVLGLILFAANLVSGAPTIHLLLLVLALPLLSMARGVLRLTAVMELLPEWRSKLLADSWIWTLLAPLVPLLALWNSAVALLTRRIRWRGIRYLLLSPGQTRILTR